MGHRLATLEMRKKFGAVPLLGEGELGPHLTQCGRGRGIPLRLVSSWANDPSNRLATIYQRHRQAGQTDNRHTVNCLIASGEPFYKRSPKNGKNRCRISGPWLWSGRKAALYWKTEKHKTRFGTLRRNLGAISRIFLVWVRTVAPDLAYITGFIQISSGLGKL